MIVENVSSDEESSGEFTPGSNFWLRWRDVHGWLIYTIAGCTYMYVCIYLYIYTYTYIYTMTVIICAKCGFLLVIWDELGDILSGFIIIINENWRNDKESNKNIQVNKEYPWLE